MNSCRGTISSQIQESPTCKRCHISKVWSVDGNGLCLGCQCVLKQNRILELEREAILSGVEKDALRSRLAKAENVIEAARIYMTSRKVVEKEVDWDMHDAVERALSNYDKATK